MVKSQSNLHFTLQIVHSTPQIIELSPTFSRRLTIPNPQSDRLNRAKRYFHPHFTPQIGHPDPADGLFHPNFIPQIDKTDPAEWSISPADDQSIPHFIPQIKCPEPTE